MGIVIAKSKGMQKVIDNNPLAQLPIDEFEEYKLESLNFDDMPTPTQTVQLQHPSHSETIGRDKLSSHPIDARAEELHHVHIWQEGCLWEDDKGLKVQWSCTSDSYLVYSYFIDISSNHHFYIIDYCIDKAHSLIEDKSQVEKWTRLAKTYRLLHQ